MALDQLRSPKSAVLNATTTGQQVLANALPGKALVVTGFLLSSESANNLQFHCTNGTTVTDLSGKIFLAANQSFVAPHNPHGWFRGIAGQTLAATLGTTGDITGVINYIEFGEEGPWT